MDNPNIIYSSKERSISLEKLDALDLIIEAKKLILRDGSIEFTIRDLTTFNFKSITVNGHKYIREE